MKTRYALLCLIALSLLLSLANLGGCALWPPDEPRFAEVAREMMQSGDYLVPRVNGQPYTEKPPLLFWMTALFSLPFGDVTEWSARMPSALAGVVTVVLTYLLARKMFGPRVALWAGLVLLTTQRFWWQSRFGQIDMVLTACLTGALLSFWYWHMERRTAYLMAFYLAIAAGALAKGPPAFIFPLLAAWAFYWRRKEERRALHWVLGVLAAVVLVGIWLVPARMAISVETSVNTGEDISANLFRQTIGRFFLGVSHVKAPWYYVLQLPVDLLPWSLFLPWTIPWVWKRRGASEEMRFLLSWIVPAFVFFSICVGKRALYLLPLFPALAILISCSLLDLMDGERARWRRRIGIFWASALFLLSVAPFAVLFTDYADSWNAGLAVLSLALFVSAVLSMRSALRNGGRYAPHHIAAGFCVLAVGAAIMVFPAVNQHKSAKEFCAPLRHLAEAGVDYDLYSVGFSREEYIYYAKHFHETVPHDLLPIPGMEGLSTLNRIKMQGKMLSAIEKAVEEVPIGAIESVSDDELKQLNEAIAERLAKDEDLKSLSRQYESGISEVFDNLFLAMDRPLPGFILVQDRDWRWVIALHPDARALSIPRKGAVGSREVLLVANAAARKLLEEAPETVAGLQAD